MFEHRKTRPTQKRLDSLIGAGTTVDGDLVFSGGLRIDGNVRNCRRSTISAHWSSASARRQGEVRVRTWSSCAGPVSASDHLELQAKAQVHGDVVYRTLEMHVGAIVQGKLMHVGQETADVVELKRATGE
jgi:cytoskeletal protein CcmA (bactofilin family)